jgi:hypothetical protein
MRAIFSFMIVFIVGTVLILVGLYFLMRVLQHYDETSQPAQTLVNDSRQLPPADRPWIQGVPSLSPQNPRQDMADMHARQTQWLESYGKSYEQGYYRIPIQDAMTLLVDKGMAATQPADKPAAGGAR